MLLKTQLILFSLIFAGCNEAPEKPNVELCIVDDPRDEAICGMTGGSTESERKPIEYIDKARCFPVQSYEKMKMWQDLMEAFMDKHCNTKK